VSAATVRLVGGITGRTVPSTLAYDAGRRALVITPLARLRAGLPYAVRVRNVRDTRGATMAHLLRWSFTIAT